METEGNLLQKMKNVFSDNEDKEKIAEEIIEKVLEGYEKGVLTRREMKMITNIFEYMDSDAKDIMTAPEKYRSTGWRGISGKGTYLYAGGEQIQIPGL